MSIVEITDGLRNAISGLGGRLDKSAHSLFAAPYLDDLQIINAYRGSAIPKKIVDIPPFDACREWREWSGSAEQIIAVMAEEKRLGVRHKVREAMTLARLFGGSAILIGTGDENPEEPLNYEAVTAGGLQYLTVLSKNKVNAGRIQTDAYDPGFGKPEYYTLSGGSNVAVKVHPSRLAIFTGSDLPDEYVSGVYTGWGDSVLLALATDLKNLEATAQNIASLTFEAKIDVIKIPDLSMNLQTHGDQYEKDLIKKLEVVAMAKGNHGLIILDGAEEYEQKKMSFATLPDVLDRFMQLVAAAADIPATRLFGSAPAGMNATGESDLRNYYDRISAMQTLEIEPAMMVLDECLVRSAMSSKPDDVSFIWRSLWQVTDKQKAETGKLYSEIIEKISTLDVLSDDALAESLIDVLTGSQIIPGLAAAVAEFPPNFEEAGNEE